MICLRCGQAARDTDATCVVCGTALSPASTTLDDAVTSFAAPAVAVPDLGAPPRGTLFTPSPTIAAGDGPTLLATLRSSSTPPPAAITSHGDSGPLAISQRFGRYTIVRLLGIGGMGAVYQAWDQELEVVVALKVIRPEALSDPAAEAEIERRFKRELLLARQVTHKNVVRIHDLGEIDGIKYITMSYVEGTELSALLKQEGPLPVPTALKIMRSIVSGLTAAHAAGVVHRDLKPANIMIDASGEALIMDFGIARSTGAPSVAVPATLPTDTWRTIGRHAETTMAGTIVGTVQYMAPEQARGLPVDQRADIYALGLIMSDMLLGRRRRWEGESAIDELQRRMKEPPPALRSFDSHIPEAIDRIVARCVQPDPATRFQTITELAAALDRLDQKGIPLPLVRRLTPTMMAVAAVVVTAMLGGTYVVTRRALAPPVQHDPVSVVIADFQNRTSDPAFDRTLEPVLKRALEGAAFISAYDRNTIRGTLGVLPPEKLDEVAARELAVKQGLGVVLSGAIDRQGTGYAISVKAVQTVTGNQLASADGRAASKEQVLEVATRLVTAVRTALGDEASESDQVLAMASMSVTSLDVVRLYSAGQDAASRNQFDKALDSLSQAVALDPKFGLGYQSMAAVSRNLGKLQDAQKYSSEALRYLDGMTERERYNTRGMFYRVTSDYQLCVKEYGELIARFAADVVGHNQLALCSSKLRNMRTAVDEMRKVVKILPNRVLFRDNLALYANYASDFQTGEKEARTIQEPDVYARLALAFAQLGQGQLREAMDTYDLIGMMNARGASIAASGLGDLAALEGRFSDAVRIFRQGAVLDVASKSTDAAAVKFTSLAQVYLLRGQNAPAVAAVEDALRNSTTVPIRFQAARSFVAAGEIARARPLIAGLAAELQAEPQAYAKIVEGEAALKDGDPRQAIKVLTEANTLLDTWIGHFDLGRAYLDAGAFAQADSEFDRCMKRRGEALSLFLDEEPTYAYFPQVYYYQGRVREGLNNAGFAESYRAYLAIRGQSKEDPLLSEVRRRAGN